MACEAEQYQMVLSDDRISPLPFPRQRDGRDLATRSGMWLTNYLSQMDGSARSQTCGPVSQDKLLLVRAWEGWRLTE